MLICKFASPRSHPDRIRSWIAYLEEKKEAHAGDDEASALLDRLLSEARVWGREPIADGPIGPFGGAGEPPYYPG